MTNEEKYQEAKDRLDQAIRELNQLCLDILKDKPVIYVVDEAGNVID